MPATRSRPGAEEWKVGFGRRLRELREERGLTQLRLSELAGVHFTYTSTTERGLRNPSLVIICEYARVLDVDAGVLLEGLVQKPRPRRRRLAQEG